LGLLGQILEHFTFEQDKLFSWLKRYKYCPLETFGFYCQIRLRRSLFLEFGKFSFKNFFFRAWSIAGCSFVEKNCFIGRVQRIDLLAKRIFLHRNTFTHRGLCKNAFKYRILCRMEISITVIFLQRNFFTNTEAL
jgi:hypothetical protein